MAGQLARGISKVGRGKNYHRRGLWALKKKHGGKFPTTAVKPKAEVKAAKAPKFYPPEDVPKPLNKNVVKRPTSLRASITPGTILILLTGRFKGKRVIFLRQLASGLLLVTGPFAVNGVPVRRVNQAYVIATSTKVDINGVDTSKINDHFFNKPPKDREKKSDEEFFKAQNPEARRAAFISSSLILYMAAGLAVHSCHVSRCFLVQRDAEPCRHPAPRTQGKQELSEEYIKQQKAVEAAILPKLSAEMKEYLSSYFSLKSADKPHEMKF